MAKLTAAKRNALPGKSFIFPGRRSYPIPDESHARNALARASGKSVEPTVRAAVHRKFPNIGSSHSSQHDGDGHHASTHHGAHVNHTVNLHLHVGGGKKKFTI